MKEFDLRYLQNTIILAILFTYVELSLVRIYGFFRQNFRAYVEQQCISRILSEHPVKIGPLPETGLYGNIPRTCHVINR